MSDHKPAQFSGAPVAGGAGHDPDRPIDQAASLQDEEPPFAVTTPDAPPIAPPATDVDLEQIQAENGPRLDHRRAAEVFADHMREGKHGSVDRDLPRNYSRDLVTLTGSGVFHGHDGMRLLAQKLRRELPEAHFTYKAKVIDGRMALLEWAGESPTGAYVDDGADSYLIENGRIVAQTIHYTVKFRST